MNALMNTKPVLAAAALAMCLATMGAARAQADAQPAPAGQMTRAEVLADMQIWRESGLAGLQNRDDSNVYFSEEYRQAQARYDRMHASPQFALLVAKFASQRGELVSAAGR